MDGGTDPAINSFHQLHYVLWGCRRSMAPSVCPQRLPITPPILALLYTHWSSHSPNYDIWAACCVAFFGFLRSGEFTCSSWASYDGSTLSLQDISTDSKTDPSMIHLSLRQSKTDTFGIGVTIYLGRTGSTLCPVSALLAYLVFRPPTHGPLFLLQSGQPLSRAVLEQYAKHLRLMVWKYPI